MKEERDNIRVSENISTSSHGDVISRLRQLLAKANEVWHVPVSQKMLALATHLDPKTISLMVNGHTLRYDERTLGLLCWYFGCEDMGQLLARVPPPGQAIQGRAEVEIGRTGPPTELLPTPKMRLVQSAIPTKLAGYSVHDVVRATGLARNTVIALRDEEGMKRIARTTLAVLCEYLDRRDGGVTEVRDVLIYSGPTPWRK